MPTEFGEPLSSAINSQSSLGNADLETVLKGLYSEIMAAKAVFTVALDGSGDYNCDGVADEVQINQAIAFVSALGGGIVHAKGGIYNCAAEVLMEDNVILEGVGAATILSFTVAGTELNLTEADDWKIRYLTVDSSGKTSGGTISNEHTIRIAGAKNFEIYGCDIEAYAFGIFVGGGATSEGRITENGSIHHNYIHGGCRNDLIGGGPFGDSTPDVRNLNIHHNFVVQDINVPWGPGTYYTAMDLVSVKGISFEQNHCWGNVLFGSERDPHQNSSIRDSWVYPVLGTTDLPVQIKIDDSANTGDQSTHLDIENNHLLGGWIRIQGTTAHHIQNVRCRGNTVVNNTALTSQDGGQVLQRGISCTYVDESLFEGNILDANGSLETGIFLADSLDNHVAGNLFLGYPTGIETSGTATGNDIGINSYVNVTNRYGSNLRAQVGTSNGRMVTFVEQFREVEANTAGSGAPNVLASYGETNKVFTNEGATAQNYHTLPTAVAGLTYTFYVQDSDGIRVTAASGDTIRIEGSVSGAAGRIDSTTVGSFVTLVAINATEWVAISVGGTWTVT